MLCEVVRCVVAQPCGRVEPQHMYMSINGDNRRSAIVLLTADDIAGDWSYVGPVVASEASCFVK